LTLSEYKLKIRPTMAGSQQSAQTRKAFVGREKEQAELLAAYQAATHGEGRSIMLAGEPGIGKTALCRQVESRVLIDNAIVLRGHCYEEYYQPYQPFVEAVKGYVLNIDPATLRDVTATLDPNIGRLLPELTERLGLDLSEHGLANNDQASGTSFKCKERYRYDNRSG
jgi:predicted ATPase